MKSLMLFDLNNLLIRGMAKLPYLSYNGVFTSGVFGLLNQMAKYILIHKPDNVIFCCDYPPYKRRQLFPNYKNRTKERTIEQEEFFTNVSISRAMCIDMLEKISIPVYSIKGYEADDIMAKIIKDKHKLYERIIIVGNDSDLFQLLQYRNVCIDRGKQGMYSYDQFKKDFGIEPEEWVEILSLAGSHNAVPPIKKGIGERTAIKIFKDKREFNAILSEFKNEIELRRRLAVLPFDDFCLPYPTFKKAPYSIKAFQIWLERKFGIRFSSNLERMYKVIFKSIK